MTEYTINYETQISSTADDDEMHIYDASAVATNKVTLAQIRAHCASGVVALTADDTLTPAEHAGRTVTMGSATGDTITLPAATGTGNTYKIAVLTTVTSNSHIIQVAASTDDEFVGVILQVDADTSDTLAAYPCLDADGFDTITMDGSTKGGIQGDHYTFTDIASGKWLLEGYQSGTGTVASPLSAAITS